jgi:glycosyltransferase involved in cell wall biosynthesis
MSLAAALDKVLGDRSSARQTAVGAARVIRRDYSWPAVAAQTAEVYRRAAGGRIVR